MSLRKYKVLIKWSHRKWGPKIESFSAEGTSIRRALNNALLGFFSDKTSREDRRDAHTQLDAYITRTTEPPIHEPANPRVRNAGNRKPAGGGRVVGKRPPRSNRKPKGSGVPADHEKTNPDGGKQTHADSRAEATRIYTAT